jgi:hypothetical protein
VALLAQAAKESEQAGDILLREGACGFIEDQDLAPDRQGAGDFDNLLFGEREGSGGGGGGERLVAELCKRGTRA